MRFTTTLLGAGLFLGAAAMLLALAADAFASAHERSVRYRLLSEALDPVDIPEDSLTWKPARHALARSFTETDSVVAGRALGSAWRAHAVATATGELDVLQNHFSGVALLRAQRSATSANLSGVRFTPLEQSFEPVFYHLDGSVLQVRAEALSVRFAMQDGKLSHYQLSRDNLTTTLMNETTGWRIFSHEMEGSAPMPDRKRAPHHTGRLAGVNYYPAKTPWRRFWPEFDPAVVAADLELISGLGANAVRIFLPTDAFALAQGDRPLQHLKTFLALAEEQGLKVVPTLFDMKPGYEPSMWPSNAAYLRRVLPVLVDSGIVPFIDLKNEPDLDFPHHGEALVEAWLRTMSALCRDIAPDLPQTIGWADAEPAARYVDLVNIVSYHDYLPMDGMAERFERVAGAAKDKPVHVTEIGASSFQLAIGFPGSPEAQERELSDRLNALTRADGVFVWTLHDFEKPDAAAVGASPWTQRLQAEFGLFDPSGTPKPAARSVTRGFEALLNRRD